MNQYNSTDTKPILQQIEQVDEIQLGEIISAVMRRFNALHTDREAAFLSLPTDPCTRDEELESIFSFIRSCYAPPDSQ